MKDVWFVIDVPDQPVMTGFPDSIGIAGTQRSFNCQITEGNPTPSFTWFRGDQKITNGVTNQLADFTSTLQYTIQANDTNVKFICRATNSQGSKSTEKSMSDVYGKNQSFALQKTWCRMNFKYIL